MTKQATKSYHPLIAEQPVDTLSHIQTLLRIAEEFTAQAAKGVEMSPHQTRVYGLLKTAGEALAYEIKRLENTPPEI